MPKEPSQSELDKWFGKKEYVMVQDVAPTAWPTAPVQLRSLLDWFTEATDILPKTTTDKRYQVKAASGFYEEFGSDTELADKAYRLLRKNRYIVSSLDSLRKTARGLKIVQIDPDSVEERRKYLEWNE